MFFSPSFSSFFFFNDTATTEIYTLSLHDALPISSTTLLLGSVCLGRRRRVSDSIEGTMSLDLQIREKIYSDRKSTRLNSSHLVISYAVFCLKKKKNKAKPSPSTIQDGVSVSSSSS